MELDRCLLECEWWKVPMHVFLMGENWEILNNVDHLYIWFSIFWYMLYLDLKLLLEAWLNAMARFDWKRSLCNITLFALCRNISDVLWEAISTGRVGSLYQGLGTKNFQSFISSFIYFYGYSFLKRIYLKRSGNKKIGTKANLIVAAAAGACTVVLTQV